MNVRAEFFKEIIHSEVDTREMTKEEAWKMQQTYEDKPHGWVQWKGTDVCMDVHCICGELTHLDAEFAYSVECCKCGKNYFVNGHIELIEIEKDEDSIVTTDQ